MAKSIVYDEDIFNEVCKRLNQLEEKSKNCTQNMKSNFSSYNAHEMLNDPVNEVNNSLSSQEKITAETEQSFQNGYGMFDDERKGTQDIENIIVPQDFVGNNAIEINYYNSTILSKIDGKSVNSGKDAKESVYDDGTVIASEELFDINKKKDTGEEEYDDTSVIGKSILGSINNGAETDERAYDDSTSVGNVKLRNINEGQTTEKSYNDAVQINNVGLTGVNGGSTVKQDFDDSSVIGQSILGSINSSKEETKEQSLDDFLETYEENRKKESMNNASSVDEQEENVVYNDETKKDE